MAKITQQEDAKEYGAATEEAQDAEALAATAAMEAETTPQLAPPEAEAAQEQPVSEQAEPPAPYQPVQPRNLMQLVPPSLLFRNPSSRLPSQQDYDVGQLWKALEQDQNTDPLVRAIAKKLLREA